MSGGTVDDGTSSTSARDAIKTILDAMRQVEREGISAKVDIFPELLEMAIAEIELWKELADEFARCIVITQGEVKPRINVDIEKFLETQHNYQLATNDLQQRI